MVIFDENMNGGGILVAKADSQKMAERYRNICRFPWEPITLVALAICIYFDKCQKPYQYPALERIFAMENDDYTGIASMVLVVWTFTMALVIFWMGRMEGKRYGIRIRDVFIKNISKGHVGVRLTVMGVTVTLELLILFLAAAYKWPITLEITALQQIVTMAYALVLVCLGSSQAVFLGEIAESSVGYIVGEYKNGQGIHKFLARMIEKTNYQNESQVNQLIEMIEIITGLAEKHIEESKEEKPEEEKDKLEREGRCKLQWYMKACMDCMIGICTSKEISERIIKNLMVKITSIDAKQGIIFSVIEQGYQGNTPDIEEILSIDFKGRNLIIISGFAYSEYLSLNSRYHTYFMPDLSRYIHHPMLGEEIMKARDIWTELEGEYIQKGVSMQKRRQWEAFWELIY